MLQRSGLFGRTLRMEVSTLAGKSNVLWMGSRPVWLKVDGFTGRRVVWVETDDVSVSWRSGWRLVGI